MDTEADLPLLRADALLPPGVPPRSGAGGEKPKRVVRFASTLKDILVTTDGALHLYARAANGQPIRIETHYSAISVRCVLIFPASHHKMHTPVMREAALMRLHDDIKARFAAAPVGALWESLEWLGDLREPVERAVDVIVHRLERMYNLE